jgi:hypothetical protein
LPAPVVKMVPGHGEATAHVWPETMARLLMLTLVVSLKGSVANGVGLGVGVGVGLGVGEAVAVAVAVGVGKASGVTITSLL